MEARIVGRTGLRVSEVGLGCNNFGARLDLEDTRRVVHRALDAGITLFDTADSYGNRGGSERLLGEILGDRRKDIVLATKFGWTMDDAETKKGGSRRYILSAVEDSLRRLRTDWIDLYQFHRPDPATPIEETLRALDDLVRAGKVRYLGCSNMAAWQVVDAAWTARHSNLNAFATAQNEYSLLVREPERELFPALDAHGLGFLPYFPLAGGLLTGKYASGAMPAGTRLANNKAMADRYLTDANRAKLEKLTAFCARRSRTLLQLAFAWLLSRPVVSSVIAGAMTSEQVDANVAAPWKLTADDVAEVDGMTR